MRGFQRLNRRTVAALQGSSEIKSAMHFGAQEIRGHESAVISCQGCSIPLFAKPHTAVEKNPHFRVCCAAIVADIRVSNLARFMQSPIANQ
jgi:hypothetical protein